MKIEFRKACLEDAQIYYKWANEELVRKNSYTQQEINFEQHMNWFKKKLSSPDCLFYFFFTGDCPVGQVRIENNPAEAVIGISIDPQYRGKRLGALLLDMACDDYFFKFPDAKITAYIKESNLASYKIFKDAKFADEPSVIVNGIRSFKLNRTKK